MPSQQEKSMVYLVKFSEFFLHGIRRGMLLQKLMERIRKVYPSSEIKHIEARILIESDEDKLSNIFGISSYVKARKLRNLSVEELKPLLTKEKIYHIRVKKANAYKVKENSLDLMKSIAEKLENAGYKMGVKNADDTLMIEMRQDSIFAYLKSEEKKGVGGFPYGSYGRGLVLFSGGFDSPVAAWLAARKGLKLDFLMISPDKEVLNESFKIYKRLVDTWHMESNFYYIEGKPLIEAISKNAAKGIRQIIMKKAIYYLGSRHAGQRAVITGDSLNQTSTQRQRLLYKIYYSIDGLFLRPLIGMSKDEIIALSKKIGTYELSEKQKEFCGIDKVVREEAKLEEIEDAFAKIKPLLDKTRVEKIEG